MPGPVAPPPPFPQAHPDPDLLDAMVQRICEGLRQTGRHGDELSCPSFADRLARHLRRLQLQYLVDYLHAGGRAEDVLLHWRILDDCADPDKRPTFHARFLGARLYGVPVVAGEGRHQELLHDPETLFLHEIIFSTVNRPKRVLAQISELVSEVELNIRQVGVYHTVDGLCLVIVHVDGWKTQDAGDLITKIKDTLALRRDFYADML